MCIRDRVTGTLERIHSQVSVSTSHNLTTGDLINFDVVPNQSVGIGTSTSINLKYDTLTDKILVNPVTCPSSGITTATNQINIVSHNFKTGDKVRYDSTNQLKTLIVMQVLGDTVTPVPDVGKYYIFVYNPKTSGIQYDQNPLEADTDEIRWGFRGINNHWNGSRQYTGNEVAGQLYQVNDSELNHLDSIPFQHFRYS